VCQKEPLLCKSKIYVCYDVDKNSQLFMSTHQIAGKNHNTKVGIDNKFFETVTKFRHVGMTIKMNEIICEEVKIIINQKFLPAN